MKKKSLRFIISLSLFIILITVLVFKISTFYSNSEKDTQDIVLETNQFDILALNSAPQKLLDIKDFGSTSKLTIRCKDSYTDFNKTKFSKDSSNLNKYLQETRLIDFNNPNIKNLSNKLGLSTLNSIECAKIILQNINQSTGFISYDQQLANNITLGNTYGKSASETLETSKGTCGEYTNLFIALMRLNNIPCKFINGCCVTPYGFSLHAWAEFWDEKKGWIPVDPQVGTIGISAYHVKLHEDIDFTSTGADFSKLLLGNAKVLKN